MPALTEQDVMELERSRWQALVEVDVPTLERLLDDQLVYTHATSLVDTKTSYVAGVGSGAYRYLEVTPFDESCVVVDGTAVVTGAVDTRVATSEGQALLHSRFTAVWAAAGAEPRLVAWHSCPRPAPDRSPRSLR